MARRFDPKGLNRLFFETKIFCIRNTYLIHLNPPVNFPEILSGFLFLIIETGLFHAKKMCHSPHDKCTIPIPLPWRQASFPALDSLVEELSKSMAAGLKGAEASARLAFISELRDVAHRQAN